MNLFRLVTLGPLLTLPLTAGLLGFSKGSLPQHTGGFREKTCTACHNSFPLNEGRTLGGTFHLSGIPKGYSGGISYPITVSIAHPGQSRWGFQVSARFANSGAQAGELAPADSFTQIVEKNGIQYIEHTAAGNRLGTEHGPVEFNFTWVGPDPAGGPVLFNAAGNAADGSDDPTGDYIYTDGAYSGGSAGTAPIVVARKRPGAVVPITDFSSHLVNLPTTRAINRGQLEFFIAHRFSKDIFRGSIDELFGLDSQANIVFGFNYGLAKGVGISIHRSRFFQTIDLAGEFNLLQQQRRERNIPVSLLVRTGVAGRDNFGLSPGAYRPPGQRRHYSPYIQLSASRLLADRLTFYAAPMVVFNSRDEVQLNFARDAFSKRHNDTYSLGLGGSLRVTRSLSLLAEAIPRISGFRGVNFDRPSISFGLQKNTSGHSFELLISTAEGLTPNEYGVMGTDTYRIGFNIYRRLWR